MRWHAAISHEKFLHSQSAEAITKPSWPSHSWAAENNKYPRSARQYAASRPRTCQLASLCATRAGGTNNAVSGRSRELVAGLDEDSCGNMIRKSMRELFAYAVHMSSCKCWKVFSLVSTQPVSKCQLTHSGKYWTFRLWTRIIRRFLFLLGGILLFKKLSTICRLEE